MRATWPTAQLDGAALRALGLDPASICDARPIASGLSNTTLWRLTLAHATPGDARWYSRRIVKQLAPAHGWLGALSGDTLIREVRLGASGVLAHLPATIATAQVARAAWGESATPADGALLLRDERGHLLRNPLHAPPGRLPQTIRQLLDRLAELHARYWNAPALDDPALGLMSPRAALLLTAPECIAARMAQGDEHPYLPLASAGWEAFFRLAPPDAAATIQEAFAAPDALAAAISALPRTLVHGDVWGPNLGWLPPTHRAPRQGHARLLLLDWALATAGPCTYDPLWLCGTWHTLHPPRILAAYRARLTRHLAAHGHVLLSTHWRALADAGYLRTALTCGEALGRTAAQAHPGAAQQRAEKRVRWWTMRAALAAQRLMAR